MKHFYLLLLLPVTLLLSGCQMPFLSSDKESLEDYSVSQAETVKASDETDALLHESLEIWISKELEKQTEAPEVASEEEEKDEEEEEVEFDNAPIINEIRQAIRVNKNLLKELQEKPVINGVEDFERIYVKVLKHRIASYEDYIQVLDLGNVEALNKAIAMNKAKDKGVLKKALIDINKLLVANELNERKTLLPEENDGNKTKKEGQ